MSGFFLQGCQARSPSPGLAFLIQWLGQLMFVSPLIALLQELQEKSAGTEPQLSQELCVTRTVWSVPADSVSCQPFCLWIPETEQFGSEGGAFQGLHLVWSARHFHKHLTGEITSISGAVGHGLQ